MTMVATEPALKFTQTMLHPNDEGNVLLRFREHGYAVLGGVFDPDSVDAYLAQLRGVVRETNNWWSPLEIPVDNPLAIAPLFAPRLRKVLPYCFWPVIDRHMVQCTSAGWLVKPSNPEPRIVHDWHKDFDHAALSGAGGYTYPLVVHAAMYFTDMTIEHGPTYVIPGSHRDPNLSPYRGTKEEPFLCRKGDVVLWDQRTWHRASARTVEGIRIMGLFAFCALPIVRPIGVSPALAEAWRNAKTPEDQVMFGGMYGLNPLAPKL